jgi:hypothetical protein
MTDDKIVRQQAEVVMVDDFYAYMPMHSYLFVPSREMWPASSVNARLQSPDGEGKASGSTVIVR